MHEFYKKLLSEKSEGYKIDKNYFFNARNMIYKKEAEKSEILKEKTYRKLNPIGKNI